MTMAVTEEKVEGLVFHPMDQFIIKPLFGGTHVHWYTPTNATLWMAPGLSLGLSAVLLVMICISDSSYSLMMSHGRAFLPPHLVGRGITLLNMTSIAGVGVMQFISRPVYQMASARHAPAGAYSYIFLLFLVPLLIGLVLYLFSPEDRHV